MAYYTKTQVADFIKEVLERGKKSEIRLMSNPEEAAQKLGDEEDLVAIFWVEPKKIDGTQNVKLSMDGKVFVKIDFDLYTDDRYAIDCYQACKEGVPVSEIVKKRELEKQKVNSNLSKNEIQNIDDKINKQDAAL